MPISPAEVARRVEQLTDALRTSGLRVTHQRLEVVREIAATDEHPDVETIYRGVKLRVPTISLDTVYRTLGTLAEAGLITRVTATAGPARFDANTAQHHHFVCTRCGLIRDVVDPRLDEIRAPAQTDEFGRVESADVHLRGICRSCARDST